MLFNLAILNRHVNIQDGHKAYNKRKPWGKEKDDTVEAEDPMAYFLLALSTDEEPDEVIEGIAAEWSHSKGVKMYRKKLLSFNTQAPVCFSYILNSANPKTITAEVADILEEARDMVEADLMDRGI